MGGEGRGLMGGGDGDCKRGGDVCCVVGGGVACGGDYCAVGGGCVLWVGEAYITKVRVDSYGGEVCGVVALHVGDEVVVD